MASENGWEPSHAPASLLEWRKVPGTNVTLQFMKGWPSTVLTAFAADFNAYVEELRDGDSAAFTPTNSVDTSNHLNATACDLNWNGADGKTFRLGITEERAYPGEKARNLRDLLAFYNHEGLQIVFCGGKWSIRDWMHFQMDGNTWNNPKVLAFINGKIRPDGFSTYKRGGTTAPPPPPPVMAPPTLSRADGYAVRIIAEGRRRNITPRGIQIALSTALVESNITVYANEKLPKSLALPHDAVGRDGLSVGIFQQQVKNTGAGWWWGDEATCMGVESSAGLFYDRLSKLNYNGSNSPGSYAQAIQRSAYPARYDERFNDAVAIYNRLAGTTPPPPAQGEDELSAEAERKIDWIYTELSKKFPSRSPLRHLGEGPLDTVSGFVLNVDGSQHVEIVRALAGYGHPPTMALLREVASADPVRYPDRQGDAQLAQAMLYEAENGTAPTVVASASPSQPEIVYLPAPTPERLTPLVPETSGPFTDTTVASTGQLIGRAYDALQELRLADALPIEDRAPLAALIAVLNTKNGAQL